MSTTHYITNLSPNMLSLIKKCKEDKEKKIKDLQTKFFRNDRKINETEKSK